MNRGITYTESFNSEKALEDYDKCIEILENLYNHNTLYEIVDYANALLNKGILLIELYHDKSGAINLWNQAISILENKETLSFDAQDTLEKLYKYKKVIEDHM